MGVYAPRREMESVDVSEAGMSCEDRVKHARVVGSHKYFRVSFLVLALGSYTFPIKAMDKIPVTLHPVTRGHGPAKAGYVVVCYLGRYIRIARLPSLVGPSCHYLAQAFLFEKVLSQRKEMSYHPTSQSYQARKHTLRDRHHVNRPNEAFGLDSGPGTLVLTMWLLVEPDMSDGLGRGFLVIMQRVQSYESQPFCY